jgi:hypothetical protein
MIYISGRITGNKHWKEDFQKAEDYWRKIVADEYIINPLHLDKETERKCEECEEKATYKDYMITDIRELVLCDSIYMLRGWWRSKGARLEHHIAKVLGLEIIYQKRGDK